MSYDNYVHSWYQWCKVVYSETGGWNPESLPHILVQLDERRSRMMQDFTFECLDEYRALVSLAAEFLSIHAEEHKREIAELIISVQDDLLIIRSLFSRWGCCEAARVVVREHINALTCSVRVLSCLEKGPRL